MTSKTEVKIVGPEYDGIEAEMGTFPDKIQMIVNHVAELEAEKLGTTAMLDPTIIQITPVAVDEEHLFIVRAWHETAAENGSVGISKPREAIFDLTVDEAHAYLHDREEETAYGLTTTETLFLYKLGGLAVSYDKLRSPMGGEVT